jgi:small-conductance mechanosensitive channel
MMEPGTFVALALPLGFAFLGLIVGLLVRRALFGSARVLRARANGSWTGVIMAALGGSLALWFSIIGLYIATSIIRLEPAIARIIQNVLVALVILSISWTLARVAGALLGHAAAGATGRLASATLLVNVTRITILGLGLLVVLQTLGVSITPVLTALGVGGLAVGLALQDTLANFFAGIHILTSGQVRPGDFIRLESGEEGYVVDVTWRYTTIRQLANNVTIVPNAKLASAITTNYYRPDTQLAVLVPVGVSYASDLRHVETVTVDVARTIMQEVPGGVPEFTPFIRYNAFADSSIAFTVILRGREIVDQYLIRHEFIKRLHERYRREGIVIPFPMRTLDLTGDTAQLLARAASDSALTHGGAAGARPPKPGRTRAPDPKA